MEKKTKGNEVKILIVDDKKENLLSLQVILAGQGYTFVEASSGKDALRILLKDQDFALILMDVQMPLMDGFETSELIRQSDRLKHVPIIFLTANMNTQDSVFKGYQSGAVDYMIKPLSPEILQAKVMVFAELYRKNNELRIKEEETQLLNSAILRANEELALQYAEIQKHAKALDIKNNELDAFTYVSSHDLQEPLRKIQTFVGMILSKDYDNLSEISKQKFQRILYSVNRMRQLIDGLLAFSRMNVADRKFEKTDLNGVLDDLREALSEDLNDKNVSIVTELEVPVTIMPLQFTQLLQNLILNAIKFSRPDVPPRITIRNRIVHGAELNYQLNPEQPVQDRLYCHILFEDNGIGFEPQYSDKIFGVFQKLHDRDAYEGTGIGLAIVKKIVESHNGFIRATGEPMVGARFDIYIPE
jgi:signal transduction histidine kinase